MSNPTDALNQLSTPGLANGDFVIRPNPKRFDNASIYLTDARRVGIMLRDRRLTLRDNSALTRFVAQLASEAGSEFILQCPNCDGDNYVRAGSKGAFFANASKKDAQRFEFVPTAIGLELFVSGSRPAPFDDLYDVSIGQWKSNYSTIPILIHPDPEAIWSSQWPPTTGSSNPASGNPGVGGPR